MAVRCCNCQNAQSRMCQIKDTDLVWFESSNSVVFFTGLVCDPFISIARNEHDQFKIFANDCVEKSRSFSFEIYAECLFGLYRAVAAAV